VADGDARQPDKTEEAQTLKVNVLVDGQSFEVVIEDLHARPVVAAVEGKRFEVWPEDAQAVESRPPERAPAQAAHVVASPSSNGKAHSPLLNANGNGNGNGNGKSAKGVCAPIPGVILSVDVRPGSQVETGQELCVLEAMKMKNLIRATRAGTIGDVRVAAGQHVKYHDLIMEYAD
jgi:glutaconyl-CoA/methylmalonyl-CoA decarboxylase subunit gamma